MPATVRITWEDKGRDVEWNEICAWAIEHFGLPGKKYMTKVNELYLDFLFQDSKDALIMSIKYSAPIISEEQLTVEFAASKML